MFPSHRVSADKISPMGTSMSPAGRNFPVPAACAKDAEKKNTKRTTEKNFNPFILSSSLSLFFWIAGHQMYVLKILRELMNTLRKIHYLLSVEKLMAQDRLLYAL
jgi:hypothetical protein